MGSTLKDFPLSKCSRKRQMRRLNILVGLLLFFVGPNLITKNVFAGKKDLESMVKFIETGEQEEADEEEDYDEDYDDDFGDDEDDEDEDAEDDEVEEESTDAHDEL